MSFFGELRRRNVFRVGIAYLAAVWVLLQVGDVVLPTLGAPEWIMQALVFSSALGFPLALVLAWFYELTPEGIKATADMEAVEAVKFTGRRVDFAIIGLLVIAVGFLLVRSPPEDQESVLPNSIAVLPFDNLSPDPDNSYFAAGIHEAVLNELAKIRDMNVIARTTMLGYAGGGKPIPEIAQELNVETVMEGSVQYAEDRVRITAQLIDPQTGAHLWSENYDRAFADIFAIQTDIAIRIAAALEAELTPAERDRIDRRPTDTPAAYALYLNALDTFNIENPRTSALSSLDRALELDPDFALAYATRAYVLIWSELDVEVGLSRAEWTDKVREDAESALQLDPNLGLGYAALARMHSLLWRRTEAEEAYERALQLSPNDPQILNQYSRFKSFTRQGDDAVRLSRRALELDPGSPAVGQPGDAYMLAGDLDAAASAYTEYLESNPASFVTYHRLGEVEAVRGNDTAALEHFRLWEQAVGSGLFNPGRGPRAAFAYSLIGAHDDARRLFTRILEDYPSLGPTRRALAYLAIGDRDEGLRLLREAAGSRDSAGDTLLHFLKFNVWRAPILEEAEFAEIRSSLGFRG